MSSDLTRIVDTVRALAKVTGAELSFDKRLRETNLGERQERTYDETDSAFPGMYDHWYHNLNWAPEGGETRSEVSNRMLAVIAELVANLGRESDTFVLMSHGGTIAAATATLLQVLRDYFSTLSGLSNTVWVRMGQHMRVSGETSWCPNAFNVRVRERELQVSDSSEGRHAR